MMFTKFRQIVTTALMTLVASNQRLERTLAHMSQDLDAIKSDLDTVSADLTRITNAVAAAVAANQALQQQVQFQQHTIDSLQAGDTLTAQQVADIKQSADAVKANADNVAATLEAANQPAPTPAPAPVDQPPADQPPTA